MELKIGPSSINSYKRLAYRPWYAIAEFVDNATQSYFDNQAVLYALSDEISPPLKVEIEYNSSDKSFSITDNAMGMSQEEVERALIVAFPPPNVGRSRYGMGMKTAACWIGNRWTITTKKLGLPYEISVDIDVEKIASGENEVEYRITDRPLDFHYTTISIYEHNRTFQGQTLRKIGDYLSSIYRLDILNGILQIKWRGNILEWHNVQDELRVDPFGKKYLENIDFVAQCHNGPRHVHGWAGVLERGSRSKAGFAIIHSGRVIRTWPENAWRPEDVFGTDAPNDLVNQRLVGEIHLDNFEVSHTKDDILWEGEDEEIVGSLLREECEILISVANETVSDTADGPSGETIERAIADIHRNVTSPYFIDIVKANPMLTDDAVDFITRTMSIKAVETLEQSYSFNIADLLVKCYISSDYSSNDPYYINTHTAEGVILILINSSHPHWMQIKGYFSAYSFLMHCIYDGIAEWQASRFTSQITPNTVRILKDRMLRIEVKRE